MASLNLTNNNIHNKIETLIAKCNEFTTNSNVSLSTNKNKEYEELDAQIKLILKNLQTNEYYGNDYIQLLATSLHYHRSILKLIYENEYKKFLAITTLNYKFDKHAKIMLIYKTLQKIIKRMNPILIELTEAIKKLFVIKKKTETNKLSKTDVANNYELILNELHVVKSILPLDETNNENIETLTVTEENKLMQKKILENIIFALNEVLSKSLLGMFGMFGDSNQNINKKLYLKIHELYIELLKIKDSFVFSLKTLQIEIDNKAYTYTSIKLKELISILTDLESEIKSLRSQNNAHANANENENENANNFGMLRTPEPDNSEENHNLFKKARQHFEKTHDKSQTEFSAMTPVYDAKSPYQGNNNNNVVNLKYNANQSLENIKLMVQNDAQIIAELDSLITEYDTNVKTNSSNLKIVKSFYDKLQATMANMQKYGYYVQTNLLANHLFILFDRLNNKLKQKVDTNKLILNIRNIMFDLMNQLRARHDLANPKNPINLEKLSSLTRKKQTYQGSSQRRKTRSSTKFRTKQNYQKNYPYNEQVTQTSVMNTTNYSDDSILKQLKSLITECKQLTQLTQLEKNDTERETTFFRKLVQFVKNIKKYKTIYDSGLNRVIDYLDTEKHYLLLKVKTRTGNKLCEKLQDLMEEIAKKLQTKANNQNKTTRKINVTGMSTANDSQIVSELESLISQCKTLNKTDIESLNEFYANLNITMDKTNSNEYGYNNRDNKYSKLSEQLYTKYIELYEKLTEKKLDKKLENIESLIYDICSLMEQLMEQIKEHIKGKGSKININTNILSKTKNSSSTKKRKHNSSSSKNNSGNNSSSSSSNNHIVMNTANDSQIVSELESLISQCKTLNKTDIESLNEFYANLNITMDKTNSNEYGYNNRDNKYSKLSEQLYTKYIELYEKLTEKKLDKKLENIESLIYDICSLMEQLMEQIKEHIKGKGSKHKSKKSKTMKKPMLNSVKRYINSIQSVSSMNSVN